MSATDPRDEQDLAWLDARERGAAALPPIDAARAAGYDGIQSMIAGLPDEAAPAGWEAEVMAMLPSPGRASLESTAAPKRGASAAAREASIAPADRRGGASRRARRAWIGGAAAAAVAAAGLLLWLHQRPPAVPARPYDEVLSIRVLRGEGFRNGSGATAAIGDVLQVEVAEAGKGELRIYRDNRDVVMRCPGQADCVQAGGRLSAELRLRGPGEYRAVYLQPAPTGPLTGTLAGDLAACRCEARTATPIVAR